MTYDCFCRRCNGEGPDCFEGGEHDFNGATCRTCGKTDGLVLGALQYEKYQRMGLTHGDHYHRSADAKARCKTMFKQEWGHADYCDGKPGFYDNVKPGDPGYEDSCECMYRSVMASLAEENP